MATIPLTKRGAEKLKTELHQLKSVERHAVIRAISEARAQGDLSENAEYEAAKDKQGFIEGRILEIEGKMAAAQIIDPAALDLAAENTLLHGVKIDLITSDYLSGSPQDGTEPDIVFGDPPWGNASDLYDSHRDEHYYRQMPAASAFPPDGQRTAIHDELIRRIVARGWRSLLILNYGILPRELVARSAQPLAEWRLLHPQPQLSVLVGRGAL